MSASTAAGRQQLLQRRRTWLPCRCNRDNRGVTGNWKQPLPVWSELRSWTRSRTDSRLNQCAKSVFMKAPSSPSVLDVDVALKVNTTKLVLPSCTGGIPGVFPLRRHQNQEFRKQVTEVRGHRTRSGDASRESSWSTRCLSPSSVSSASSCLSSRVSSRRHRLQRSRASTGGGKKRLDEFHLFFLEINSNSSGK